MKKAKIYLVSRAVDAFKLGCVYMSDDKSKCASKPQHMFVIHENSAGKHVIYRGGPSNSKGLPDMLFGDLEIVSSEYIEEKQVDWVDDKWKEMLPILEIDSGSDEEIGAKFEDLKDWIRDFNEGKYDYKLPVGEQKQNSNAAARLILEQLGYESKLPSYVNDNGEEVVIKAPGYDSDIGNTSFDRRVKDFSKKYELNKQKLVEIYKQKANDLKEGVKLKNDALEKKYLEKMDIWKMNKKAELEKKCEIEKQAAQEALNSRCNEFNADEVYHSEMDGRKTVHYKCIEAFECQQKLDKEEVEKKIYEFFKELQAEKNENLEEAVKQNDVNFAELQNDVKQEREKFLASVNSMLEPFVEGDMKVAGLDGFHGEL